jgi:CHAT domain-containing protein/tetratricopeptide (TPR) repeat protein
MRLRSATPTLLIWWCLLAPALAIAAVDDEVALARCDSLYAHEQFSEVVASAQSLLAAIDARGDSTSTSAASALTMLVRGYLARGGRAEPAFAAHASRLLSLTRSLYGADGAEFATAVSQSGQVAERSGDFAGARASYERALAIRTAAKLPANLDLVNCLVSLANVRARLGDYDGLGAVYDRALAIAEEVSGPRALDVARVLGNYAIFKKLTGDFAAARDLYERTLAIQIGAHGEVQPDVARTYFNLGNLLVEIGQYDAARADYQRSLEIREQVLGAESPEVARTLAAMVVLEKQTANLLLARDYAERAVAIQQKALPAQHPQTADALAKLASVQSDLGDFGAARATLEQVRAVFEKAYGPTHQRVGEIVAELGMLQELEGDLTGALSSYRRTRDIFTAIDPHHDRVAGSLNDEATLLADLGHCREAVAVATRSVAIRERLGEPAYQALGQSLATQGRCLWQCGDLARAETALRRSREILVSRWGETHPLSLTASFDLARALRTRGATGEALDLALAVERGRRESVRLTIRGLPERLALVHAKHFPSGLDLAISIAAQNPPAATAVGKIWSELLSSRALVLDEMAQRRRAEVPTRGVAVDSLQHALGDVTRELAGTLVDGWRGEESAKLAARSLELRGRREQIEQRLGGLHIHPRSAGRVEDLPLAQIAASLPTDAALVGYVRYERQLQPSATDTLAPLAEPAYAAFVLSAGRREPVVVDLGSAAKIDRLVRTWRDEAGLGRDVPGRNAVAATAACDRAGAALREQIWDPLTAHLGAAGRVYVVPDGPLHLVNLAALPTRGGRYLIDDDRLIVNLGTERDLVERPPARPARGELLAIGAPDFSSHLAPLEFAPLPASAQEVGAVAAIWRRSRPVDFQVDAVMTLLGREASEAAFKRLAPGFRALHIATHGFALAEGAASPLAGQRGVGGLQAGAAVNNSPACDVNPMLRSGLVLAGGDQGDGEGEDGILTAAEIAVMDLGAADWVVLSACESGVGLTQAGEGVFGLRRAFRIAGARGLVISLWPLADDQIRDWMLQLYTAHLIGRQDLSHATWQASRAVLAARRAAGLDTHPQTWASFIATGD